MVAMFDEAIGQPQLQHRQRQARGLQGLEHGGARATGDSATGISVQSNSYGYDVTLNNAGKITVVGNDGDAYGAYVETDGYGTLSITSSGDITATSSGYNTYAVGLYAQHEGYGAVNITSSSKITVISEGQTAEF